MQNQARQPASTRCGQNGSEPTDPRRSTREIVGRSCVHDAAMQSSESTSATFRLIEASQSASMLQQGHHCSGGHSAGPGVHHQSALLVEWPRVSTAHGHVHVHVQLYEESTARATPARHARNRAATQHRASQDGGGRAATQIAVSE